MSDDWKKGHAQHRTWPNDPPLCGNLLLRRQQIRARCAVMCSLSDDLSRRVDPIRLDQHPSRSLRDHGVQVFDLSAAVDESVIGVAEGGPPHHEAGIVDREAPYAARTP